MTMAGSEPLWTPMPLIRVTAEFFTDKGIDSARLDAELLLAHVLGCTRLQLYLDSDRPIVPDELNRYRELVKRRGRREPLQLLIGHVEILEHEFLVRPGVFIPRPETEVLIEVCRGLDLPESPTIVEVGVGTGCVGLSLMMHFAGASLIGFDVNPRAIELTGVNAERLGLRSRVELREGDALEPGLPSCDLLVSNPPYVPGPVLESLQPEVRDHDPPEALDGGPGGLDFLRRLVPLAARAVRPGGWIALEHGDEQGAAVVALVSQSGFGDVEVVSDLAERDRVTVGRLA